jgi:glyoxylase-like metal-dependent hydrolase (beta-lactamase superfamily II)
MPSRTVSLVTHGSIRLGDVEVTPVCEGYAPIDVGDEMPGQDVSWAEERARHPWVFLDDRTWAWHVHAFAVRTPAGVAMVDTGLGSYPPYRPWAESTNADRALAGAGVEPGEVRAVVHTHLHADHAGGAVIGGRPRFPNAVHHAHPADWSFFGRPERIEGYTARGPMGELERLGMLDLTEADHEVLPGLRVQHAPGHTPGHRVAVIETPEGTIVLTGDLLHLPVQVARPLAPSSHDEDPAVGCRSRAGVLRQARDGGWHVAVSHFARPFGRVADDGWRAEA